MQEIDKNTLAEVKAIAEKTCAEVDTFVANKLDNMDALRDKHLAYISGLKAQLNALDRVIKEKQTKLLDEEAHATEVREQEEALEREIEALKKEETPYREKIAELEAAVTASEGDMRQKEQMYDEQRRQLTEQMEALEELHNTYSNALGLSFENSTEDELRVIFRYVDRREPARECSFSVKLVNDNGRFVYTLSECTPYLEQAGLIVDQLNVSNDFSRTVVQMRQLFASAAGAV